MISLNNVELNLGVSQDEHTPFEEVVIARKKEISEIFKGRFPLMFSYVDSLISEAKMHDSSFRQTRIISTYPNRPISPVAKISVDGEIQEIRYYESRTYDANRDKYAYQPKSIAFDTATLSVNENNLDLAFFILYVHPFVAGGLACEDIVKHKKNPRSASSPIYKFIDTQKIASGIILKGAAEDKVKSLIYYEMSDEQVKKMCMHQRVANSDMQNGDELRVALFSFIKSKANRADSFQNIYGDFEAAFNQLFGKKQPVVKEPKAPTNPTAPVVVENDVTEEEPAEKRIRLLSIVTEAEKVKAIGKKSGANASWFYRQESNANMGSQICKIIKDDAVEDLVDVMMEDDKIVDAIERLIKIKTPKE